MHTPNPEEVHQIMTAYSDDAVDFAKRHYDAELDYSENSLDTIEEVLGVLSDGIPKQWYKRLIGQGPSQEELEQMAKMWGGYVGEVIRKKYGGEWSINTELVPGEFLYALKIEEHQMFPVNKVLKRLLNGDEDNIVVYQKAFEKIMLEGIPEA